MFKLLPVLFLVSLPVLANDTAATVGAGGITFKKSNDISMDEEVLKISTTSVDVNYVFTNHAAKDIEETFAFPLPPSPHPQRYSNWDESAFAYKFLYGDGADRVNANNFAKLAPFLNFTVFVDGDERVFNYQLVANDKQGKDITSLLKKENIPLSSTYLTGYQDEPPLEKMSEVKAKLKKLGLLDANGLPNWTTTTTYYWSQWFAKKSSKKIKHTYRPATGFYSMEVQKDKKGKFSPKFSLDENPDFCIDQKTLARFYKDAEAFKKKKGYARELRATVVHYILQTANNWSGPIKKFKLEVTAPKNASTFFCFDHEVKKRGNLHIAEVSNFTPKRDLRIVFLNWE
jgi:hypothetical protein